ncbi:MAG: sulfatase-like hydrolase/transferase [Chryseolinea sp.]
MKQYILFFIFTICSCCTIKTLGQSKAPNVLFIAVDDLKPYLEPYGDKIVKSPAIASIASKGIVFEKNYCQQAVCAPTRASLMTGLRPDRTGVWDLKTNFRLVDPSIVTMPEYLITQGYETAALGKIYHPELVTTFEGHDPKSWSIPYQEIKARAYVTTEKRISLENMDVPDTTYYDGKLAVAGSEDIRAISQRC